MSLTYDGTDASYAHAHGNMWPRYFEIPTAISELKNSVTPKNALSRSEYTWMRATAIFFFITLHFFTQQFDELRVHPFCFTESNLRRFSSRWDFFLFQMDVAKWTFFFFVWKGSVVKFGISLTRVTCIVHYKELESYIVYRSEGNKSLASLAFFSGILRR